MIRILAAILLPLLLPLGIWFVWVKIHRARRLAAGLDPNVAPEVPVVWLAVAGTVLVIFSLGLIYFYSDQGAPAGTPYVPAPDSEVNLNAWPIGGDHPGAPKTGSPERGDGAQ